MLEVFGQDLKKRAILQNVISMEEREPINSLSHLRFELPRNDPKAKYCTPFSFVRFEDRMYRILPITDTIGVTGPTISYECEHVIATLIDDVMPGDVVIGNRGTYTTDVLKFVLSKQTVKHWKLGVCEFSRQFEYGWSDESLLAAMFSVPNLFTTPYIWDFDTSSYPWTVNLRVLDTEQKPQLYIHKGKNIITLRRQTDPTNICTRLYAKGYGEGVNALTFADINGGKPYIDSPKEYRDKYGLKTRVWVDRRYENKESLLQAAKSMLEELQEPGVEYEVEFTEIDQAFLNKAKTGKVVKIASDDIQYKTYVTEVTRSFTVEGPKVTLAIANRPKDIASSIADLADRQRIEMTYAQGATQLYAQSLQANCDAESGAKMQFYIPQEMRIVNSVKVKVQVESFRAYSKTTSVHQQQNQTSSSGGGSTQTSSSGGGGTVTSAGGGGSTEDTGPGGINVQYQWFWTQETQGHSHQYRDVVSHQHRVTIPDHVHQVNTQPHTHYLSIPAHEHTVTIPAHEHDITPGIYRFGNPNKFKLYVDGALRISFDSMGEEVDITKYLIDPQGGKIQRGTWHSIEIVPNDLAYVFLDMYVQGFVQSRGDNTV